MAVLLYSCKALLHAGAFAWPFLTLAGLIRLQCSLYCPVGLPFVSSLVVMVVVVPGYCSAWGDLLVLVIAVFPMDIMFVVVLPLLLCVMWLSMVFPTGVEVSNLTTSDVLHCRP